MRELVDIRGEMDEAEGKKPRNYDPPRKRSRGSRGGSRGRTKPDQPPADPRSRTLAQTWMDLGNEAGMDFPYNTNYFALALQRKVDKDPAFKKLTAAGHPDRVRRWIAKMIELWWKRYVDQSVTARNAKEYFLQTDWEDVQEYARTNLRAKYLKKHGRKVPPPLYPAQQEYQERLRNVREQEQVAAYLRDLEDAPDRPELDSGGRERLRSFVEQRRKK